MNETLRAKLRQSLDAWHGLTPEPPRALADQDVVEAWREGFRS